MPAPRGGIDEQAAAHIIADLRAAAREAREALGDLQRERKAVEQLARERAESVIASHVNACLTELTEDTGRQLGQIRDDVHKFCRDMIEAVSHGTEHPEPPSMREMLNAADVLARAEAHGMLQWGGTKGGEDGSGAGT